MYHVGTCNLGCPGFLLHRPDLADFEAFCQALKYLLVLYFILSRALPYKYHYTKVTDSLSAGPLKEPQRQPLKDPDKHPERKP